MKRKGRSGFWGASRRAFRWCRISIWSIILLLVLALLYLNQIGLPNFIKRRVVAAMESAGLQVEFSRLRLKGFRKIVVDNISLGASNAPAPIKFTAREAELGFENSALRRMQFNLDAIALKNGRLVMELAPTNAPSRPLEADEIDAEIWRQKGDRWNLALHGRSLGADWNVSGSLTNVFALSKPTSSKAPKAANWKPALREFLDTLETIQFASPPRIIISTHGDLNELSQFKASVALLSEQARTPWGNFSGLIFRSALAPSVKPGERIQATLSIRLESAETPWAGLKGATLLADTAYPLTNTVPFESFWRLQADEATGQWFSGAKVDLSLRTRETSPTNLQTVVEASALGGRTPLGEAARTVFDARLQHAYPVAALNSFFVELLPVKPAVVIPVVPETEILKLGQHWAGDWRLTFDGLRVKNGAAGKLSFTGDVRERPDSLRADASWGFWRHLAPMLIRWQADATDFQATDARIDRIAAKGDWRAPKLTIEAVDSELYGGGFHSQAALDVSSRLVQGAARMDFDLKKISPFLDPEVRGFLGQFSWNNPPKIAANVALTLPAWTNSFAGAQRDILKSTALAGTLEVGPASFRGVTFTGASTHFNLTNFQWRLPDLILKREEGQLNLDYTGHAFEPDFRLEIRGGINPWAALPLLNKEGQEGLKFVEFKESPLIDGVLTGKLDDPSALVFTGNVALTNFLARKEPFLDAKASIVYSNQWIFISEPVVHRTSNEVATASWATVDLRKMVMYVTNGFSTTDPYIATKVMGPVTQKAIAPYIFKAPPTVRANGIIPLKDEDDADIQFQISGQDFQYWRFNMTQVSGGVHWHGDLLEVTNIQARFYGGSMDWEGHFKFLLNDSADYRFKGVATNADLGLLLRDLLPGSSNKLDGTLHGTVTITSANTEDLKTWKGFGEGQLRDGFLWDIPIFGIFSGPLDAVVPGFGKSRVSSGQGTFRIEDGKVHTRDMEVRAPAFRLKYDGSVDFDGNLDAKVEAQLFRDAWIFGRAMSAALWPLAKAFESKISGNLAAPKSELAHIPKIMLFPLRPIQTLKELLPKDKEKEK